MVLLLVLMVLPAADGAADAADGAADAADGAADAADAAKWMQREAAGSALR